MTKQKVLYFFLLMFLFKNSGASEVSADFNVDGFIHEKYELSGLDASSISLLPSDVINNGTAETTDSICVYSNKYIPGDDTAPQLKLGATSDNNQMTGGSPAQFIVKDGNGNIFPYRVFFNFNDTGYTEFTEGQVTSQNISMQSKPDQTCGEQLSDNMVVKIKVQGQDMVGKPADIYTDTLFIDVFSPET